MNVGDTGGAEKKGGLVRRDGVVKGAVDVELGL